MLTRRNMVMMAFAALATAGALLLRTFDPAHSLIFPPCPLRYFTGLYCLGCGSLRALHALLHGNLEQAIAMNALTVLLLPFIAWGLISEIHMQVRGRPIFETRMPASWIRALFAVIVLFGIARNLPFRPFDLLAPGALLRP